MEIRTFQEADRAGVIELWRRCDLVRPWNDPDRDIDRKRARDPDNFLVATREGRLVAAAMAGYEGHRGWVNYFAVDPDLQGLGIGRELMEEIEGRLLALGCPKINLQVRTANEAARAFYERLGFEVDASISMGKRLIPDD